MKIIKVVQRIYLSGPITGIADYHQRFEKAKVELVAAGYNNIANPAELDGVINEGKYDEYMSLCMSLLDMCDVVVMLPGWKESLGANREYGYALAKNKLIFELEDMLEVQNG